MSIETFNNTRRRTLIPATSYLTASKMRSLFDDEVTKMAHTEMANIMEEIHNTIKECGSTVTYCVLNQDVRTSVTQMLSDLGYTVKYGYSDIAFYISW